MARVGAVLSMGPRAESPQHVTAAVITFPSAPQASLRVPDGNRHGGFPLWQLPSEPPGNQSVPVAGPLMFSDTPLPPRE